jgi:hypothetical protein
MGFASGQEQSKADVKKKVGTDPLATSASSKANELKGLSYTEAANTLSPSNQEGYEAQAQSLRSRTQPTCRPLGSTSDWQGAPRAHTAGNVAFDAFDQATDSTLGDNLFQGVMGFGGEVTSGRLGQGMKGVNGLLAPIGLWGGLKGINHYAQSDQKSNPSEVIDFAGSMASVVAGAEGMYGLAQSASAWAGWSAPVAAGGGLTVGMIAAAGAAEKEILNKGSDYILERNQELMSTEGRISVPPASPGGVMNPILLATLAKAYWQAKTQDPAKEKKEAPILLQGNEVAPEKPWPQRDDDNDGVLNINDSCKTKAEDMDGYQDHDGCPDPDPDDLF